MNTVHAVLLIALVASLGAVPGAAADFYAIDADHDLASSEAIAEYEQSGYVTTALGAPDLRISIAQEEADVGADTYRSDFMHHYLRIQYNETLPAEFRLYIPVGYWHPHPQKIKSITDGTEATFGVAKGGEYTIVTFAVEGRTDAVFPVTKTASTIFSTRDVAYDAVENRTNVTAPRLGDSEPWNYIDKAAMTGNSTTVAIHTAGKDTTVQYDADSGIDERWLAVPECTSIKGEDASICRFTRDGKPEQINLLARSSDPPTVRYKHDAGFMADVNSILDGIGVTGDRIAEWASGILPRSWS